VWYCRYEVRNPTGESHTFLPDLELVTAGKVYHDTVLPGAEGAARRLEDPAGVLDLKNSVTVALEPIPPAKRAARKGVAGVAFWEGVDPDARGFTIFVSGLSNAWSAAGDAVRRKVLKLTFKRAGGGMTQVGPAEWVYRSYPRKAEEATGDPRAEVERLIAQLEQRIADEEAASANWKEERQRLRDRIRELRRLAEQPPADRKPEDRAAVARDVGRRTRQMR
jgi:hypothetical protein